MELKTQRQRAKIKTGGERTRRDAAMRFEGVNVQGKKRTMQETGGIYTSASRLTREKAFSVPLFSRALTRTRAMPSDKYFTMNGAEGREIESTSHGVSRRGARLARENRVIESFSLLPYVASAANAASFSVPARFPDFLISRRRDAPLRVKSALRECQTRSQSWRCLSVNLPNLRFLSVSRESTREETIILRVSLSHSENVPNESLSIAVGGKIEFAMSRRVASRRSPQLKPDDTFVSRDGTKAEQEEFSYKSPGPEARVTASGSTLARSQRQREREAEGRVVVKGVPRGEVQHRQGRGAGRMRRGGAVIHASYLTVDKHS